MAPIIAFMLLTILSYISVACIRRLALRYEILDKPNERSSHSIPMPRGGGLAIVFLVLAVSLWAANQVDINRSIIYIVLSAIVARVGWRDDLFSLSPDYRFLVQGLVTTISILEMGYFRVVKIPLLGELDLGAVGIMITFLRLVHA